MALGDYRNLPEAAGEVEGGEETASTSMPSAANFFQMHNGVQGNGCLIANIYYSYASPHLNKMESLARADL